MPTFLSFSEKASSIAVSANILLLTMLAVGFLIAIVIAVLALRALSGGEEKEEGGFAPEQERTVPKVWTFGIGVIIIIFFLWSSLMYLNNIKTPSDAEDVISVAKHWVWKFQHTPDGKGEIDELHVVVGKPVRLIMTSQDTTHSIFAPGLMQQQDILPGKFTTMWFTAAKAGEFPFYESQYSGTGYTKMAGKIIAMEQADYDAWLSGKAPAKPGEGGEAPAGGLVAEGESLFAALGCAGCHSDQDTAVAPTLHGIYGKEVALSDGGTVTVDDAYLHESIVDPSAKIVEGYNDIMPKNYGADLSADELEALIAYIKSLSGVEPAEGGEEGGAAPTKATDATQAPEPTQAAEAPTASGVKVPTVAGDPAKGAETFSSLGCVACHTDADTPLAPTLHGLYGSNVQLENEPPVVANDAFIIESIIDPSVKLVEGYSPVMPQTFASLSEQDLADLLAYIKSLAQ